MWTSSFVTDGGFVSGDVDGHDPLVAVLRAELQDVVRPVAQSVDAAKDQSGLKIKHSHQLENPWDGVQDVFF